MAKRKYILQNRVKSNTSNVVEENIYELVSEKSTPSVPVLDKHSELSLDDGTNPHGTTKTDVGLDNVDNTSDLNKPISTATQNSLDTKTDKGGYTGTSQDLKDDIDSINLTPTENKIIGIKTTSSVNGTYNIDLNLASDFHLIMTADTAFTFTNTPTGQQVKRCKIRLTGEFIPSWTQTGLEIFGEDYDGTLWNDILPEMWDNVGTLKGILIFQKREIA